MVIWTMTEEIIAESPIEFNLQGVRNPRTFQETGAFFITTLDSDHESVIDSGYNMVTEMSTMGFL